MSKGSLTVISGCVSAGKSTELLRLIDRAERARRQTIVFVPTIDTRSDGAIVSRTGGSRLAFPVARASEIPGKCHLAAHQVVVLDEAQFFDRTVIQAVNLLLDRGQEVIAAGLDTDFRGDPFGPMPDLLALADQVIKLDAICVRCGRRATRSQRLIAGRPAPQDSPLIQVGGDEAYEARCRDCHEVPRS
jgi:thymidine kinase